MHRNGSQWSFTFTEAVAHYNYNVLSLICNFSNSSIADDCWKRCQKVGKNVLMKNISHFHLSLLVFSFPCAKGLPFPSCGNSAQCEWGLLKQSVPHLLLTCVTKRTCLNCSGNTYSQQFAVIKIMTNAQINCDCRWWTCWTLLRTWFCWISVPTN